MTHKCWIVNRSVPRLTFRPGPGGLVCDQVPELGLFSRAEAAELSSLIGVSLKEKVLTTPDPIEIVQPLDPFECPHCKCEQTKNLPGLQSCTVCGQLYDLEIRNFDHTYGGWCDPYDTPHINYRMHEGYVDDLDDDQDWGESWNDEDEWEDDDDFYGLSLYRDVEPVIDRIPAGHDELDI